MVDYIFVEMSEVREYAMILQTIMLTNVLNNNDSYVCSSSLYIRFPLNAIFDLQRASNSYFDNDFS